MVVRALRTFIAKSTSQKAGQMEGTEAEAGTSFFEPTPIYGH